MSPVPSDEPITSPEAWSPGLWLRTRSGPTRGARNDAVNITVWHQVRDVAGWNGRIRTVCGYGPRDGFVWPSGGLRMELARPGTYGTLPGAVCPRCKAWPEVAAVGGPHAEIEHVVVDPDFADLDELASRVAAHIIERTDEARK